MFGGVLTAGNRVTAAATAAATTTVTTAAAAATATAATAAATAAATKIQNDLLVLLQGALGVGQLLGNGLELLGEILAFLSRRLGDPITLARLDLDRRVLGGLLACVDTSLGMTRWT
jgi:hypothetical protein